MPSDLSLFLRQLIRRPQQVVALSPSSADLARAMTAGLSPATGRVAELGAGTGKLTRAILDRGVAASDLTVFELNPEFCDHLRRQFPGIEVINDGAETLGGRCTPGLGAVISGLPLLSMPSTLQMTILQGAFNLLRPKGGGCAIHLRPTPAGRRKGAPDAWPVGAARRNGLGQSASGPCLSFHPRCHLKRGQQPDCFRPRRRLNRQRSPTGGRNDRDPC